MVTWGTNQVFPAGGAQPSPFGSPAPTPGGGSLFGAPSPAPSGFFGAPAPSLFGSAPSSFSGGLFGSSSSTPSASFFGQPPASGGLFGTPAPQQQQQQPQQPPQIPAQAALQAHMDASARQEAAKLQNSLEILHNSYAGITNSVDKSSPFVTIVYNDMTPEQLQWHFAHSQAAGSLVVPPKPPQVSEQDWFLAVAQNPDPKLFIPTALIGAEALQARLGWQQDRANTFSRGVADLAETREIMDRRAERYKEHMAALERIHMGLSKRLLEVMRKVELVRCMNLPFQMEERNLMERLVVIRNNVEKVGAMLDSVRSRAPEVLQNVDLPDETTLMSIFIAHHSTLGQLSEVVQKDKRDVAMLQERHKKSVGLRN
jgi:hypothetical protein